MKNPTPSQATRSTLLRSAVSTRYVASILATGGLTASVTAADWTGSTSRDWNDGTNWSEGAVPADENAVINDISSNVPLISADIAATPVDIILGNGAGSVGQVDHTAGTAQTGEPNWMFIGREGGSATYNLADPEGSGGSFTGMGQGSGTLNGGNRLYVGGSNVDSDGSTGTLNVHTTGGVSFSGDLVVGALGATGVMNLDSGSVSSGGWAYIGQNASSGGTASDGTLNISGGSITHNGSRTFVGLGNSTGQINISGGSYSNVPNTGNSFFAIGVNNLDNAATSSINMSGGTIDATRRFSVGGMATGQDDDNEDFIGPGKGELSLTDPSATLNVDGEFWVGQGEGSTGDFTFDAGTVNGSSWVAIGRETGTGTVNMSGGTWNKTDDGNFIIGASGPGTMTQSGGLVDVQSGITWIGELDGATGTLTLSGSGEFNTPEFSLGVNGGATGTANFDGGIARTAGIVGGDGAETVNFNGTQFIATDSNEAFLADLDTVTIEDGGLLVDTAGFNLSTTVELPGSGGVTKDGDGTLSLVGVNNTYSGDNTVNAGRLVLGGDDPTAPDSTGDITVADGATVGVTSLFSDDQLSPENVTFGSSGATALDLNYGDLGGFLPANTLLNVSDTMTVNGEVTVNVTGELFDIGELLLLSYDNTTRAGGGSFALGNLPNGVEATLVDDPDYFGADQGAVYLDITGVSQPVWDGVVDGQWDTTTENWYNAVTLDPATYSDPDPVLFDDTAQGTTDVVLDTTVMPSSVTFSHSTFDYTLNGGGSISGSTGLTKQGGGTLTIGGTMANDYTGVTRVEEGTLSTDTLPNGGSPGPIGAASADPANLQLAGGALAYTGAATTTDRGVSLEGRGTLSNDNALTLSGTVTATDSGGLTKTGSGELILTGEGPHTLGLDGENALVEGGTLTLDGGADQTVNVPSELWVGTVPDVSGNLNVTAGTLDVGGWLTLGRGNGDTGTLSTITAMDATINCTNFSTGFDNGLENDSVQEIQLTDSTFTNNGRTALAESANADTTMNIEGTSSFETGRFQMALGTDTQSVVNIRDSGSFTKRAADWFSIGNGNGGDGTINVEDSGSLTIEGGDINISDVDPSTGTLNVSGSATADLTGTVFVGKNTNTAGVLNQSGGTVTCNNWLTVGRFADSTGEINLTGGTLDHVNGGEAVIIGEEGQGTLTVSGTGTLNVTFELRVGQESTGNGTVNLDTGGTISTPILAETGTAAEESGTSAFNFDGGTLIAAADNADFLFVDTAQIEGGGGTIDTNGNSITINQDFSGAGALDKTGAGTLLMNGANTFDGTMTVTEGTFGGSGSFAGPLSVESGTTLAPGDGVGTLSSGDATVSGTYAYDIDGSAGDSLMVTGDLDVSGADLEITEINPASASVYVIAGYTGTLTSPFNSVTGIPDGWTLEYDHNGGTQVALVNESIDPFNDWIAEFYPGETDPAIVGKDADPDGDGQINEVEFALGGSPDDPADNAIIRHFVADSDADADSDSELLVTIAVRAGTPVFTGDPSPTATHDEVTYAIEGSATLDAFAETVVEVGAVTGDLPAAPEGYEYRTFSLTGSNGLPSLGFLRVNINP